MALSFRLLKKKKMIHTVLDIDFEIYK